MSIRTVCPRFVGLSTLAALVLVLLCFKIFGGVQQGWKPPSPSESDDAPPSPSESDDAAPYLAFIVACQNSDYGGKNQSMGVRLQRMIDTIAYAFVDQGMDDIEVIIVETPPKEGFASIASAITWPVAIPLVRIIQMSDALLDVLGRDMIHEYIGKNVGARRANAQFLLFSGTDNIFTPEVGQYLAQRQLDRKNFYRLGRHDLEFAPPAGSDAMAALDFITAKLELPSVPLTNSSAQWSKCLKPNANRGFDFSCNPHTAASGDFFLISAESFAGLGGYWSNPDKRSGVDSLICFMAVAYGLDIVWLTAPLRMFHPAHDRGGAKRPSPYRPYQLMEAVKEARSTGNMIFAPPPDFSFGYPEYELREDTIHFGGIVAHHRPPLSP